MGLLPTLPDVPSLPEIPSVPTLPDLPVTVPSLPSLPSIPSIPSFSSLSGAQNLLGSVSGLLRGGSLVVGVEVSVITSEAHSLQATATKQSIESGAQVTDHIILTPPQVAITFEVANVGDGPQIAKDVFETFKAMMEARELLEVVTEHYVYDNMALVGLSPMHQAPYKGRLQCTATLQRVNQIQLQVVGRVPKKLSKDGAGKSASAPVDAGPQIPDPPKVSWLEQTRRKAQEQAKKVVA